jgi:hypothetical protein
VVLFFVLPQVVPDTRLSRRLSTTLDETFSLSMEATDAQESSAAAHRAAIRKSWIRWMDNFYLGEGYGAHPLVYYDSQIALVPGSTGLLGVLGFLFMLLVIAKRAFYLFGKIKDEYLKGLIVGFIGMFFVMLVQSVPMVTFLVTLTAAPFWFFAGIVLNSEWLDSE